MASSCAFQRATFLFLQAFLAQTFSSLRRRRERRQYAPLLREGTQRKYNPAIGIVRVSQDVICTETPLLIPSRTDRSRRLRALAAEELAAKELGHTPLALLASHLRHCLV
jgi:hypothetical protein